MRLRRTLMHENSHGYRLSAIGYRLFSTKAAGHKGAANEFAETLGILIMLGAYFPYNLGIVIASLDGGAQSDTFAENGRTA